MRVEVDADFAAWASARERPFLCAAYLIRGDRREAEAVVVGVLASVAPRWDRLRQDDPDAEARRLLHRDALACHRDALAHHRRRGDLGEDPDRIAQDCADLGSEASRALRAITPRQRAVLVLRGLEDRSPRETADALGSTLGAVESELAVGLARIEQVLPWVDGLAAVAALLDRATERLPDVDLADRAWATATQRGRRRRRSLAVTTAAVLLGAGVSLATSQGSRHDTVPGPTSAVTARPTTAAPSSGVAADGTRLFLAPSSDAIADLPSTRVGAPSEVSWDPRAAPQPLAQIVTDHAGSSGRANLRIVYAVLSGRAVDRWVPVLLVRDDRDGSLNYASVDVTLGPMGTDGETGAPLGARAIDPTGTEAIFLQPRGVTVVDVTSGRTRTSAMPGEGVRPSGPLVDGGFSDTGRILVRAGDGSAWSLDPVTLAWTPVPTGSGPEDLRIVTTAGASRLDTPTPEGAPGSFVPVRLPMARSWGGTVVAGDWVATGGTVEDAAVPEQFRVPNALFLVSRSHPSTREALLLGASSPGEVTGGVRAIGVAGRVVLFQYSVAGRTLVLGVDPTTGLMSRVAEVWSPVDGVGTGGPVIALSPWAISHR